MGRIEESYVAVDWINYQRVPSQPDHVPGLFLEGMVCVCDSHSRYRILGSPKLESACAALSGEGGEGAFWRGSLFAGQNVGVLGMRVEGMQ
jgi:hypothetical protein